MNMTDEQMRIAIAEACGFTCISPVCWRGHLYGFERKVPDYLNDLNAMHEAEKVLLTQCGNDPQDDLWIDYLANLLHAAPFGLREHATARQRAEAFIKTLNLEPK